VAKLLELRQRIRAVENIQTISRTLATVAAAKLARTRRRAAGLRRYAHRIREILLEQQLAMGRRGRGPAALSSVLEERRPVRAVALLVLTADRGMCGGYSLEACRLAARSCEAWRRAGQDVALVLKGRKGATFFARRGARIVHREGWGRGTIGATDVERLLQVVLDLHRSRAVDEVWVVYTEFHSPIRRYARVVRMLPVELPPARAVAAELDRWTYEPSAVEILDELLGIYLRVQLCDVLLESYASEQGARMITMEEASERADRTLQECRVQHNRLRREAITIDLLGALFAGRAIEEEAVTPRGPA
jgi:F-type H+-transporting ATPase subunit gamma